MDKIWYRNPSKSEDIAVVAGMKKNEWPHRTDKSWTLKEKFGKNCYNSAVPIYGQQ